MRLEFVNRDLTTCNDVDSLKKILGKYKSIIEEALLMLSGHEETIYISNNKDSITIKDINKLPEEQLLLMLKHVKESGNDKQYKYILHKLHEINFGYINDVKSVSKPKYNNSNTIEDLEQDVWAVLGFK